MPSTKNNRGRPPGAKNRYSKALAAKMRESGFTEPLDILLMIANDPTVDVDIRARAAKDACPFVHKRKPQAVEVAGKFEFLSPDEREMRRRLILEEIGVRLARTARREPDSASD